MTKDIDESTRTATDQLFAEPLQQIERFSFNKSVVDVFPDMIQRSIPGYSTIIGMIGDLAERFATDNSRCYDLGCSLGAASLAMRRRISANHCEIIAIDNSAAMVEQCQRVVARDHSATPVSVHCANLQDIEIERASVVVLNFTLQFISPAERDAIMAKIFNGLLPGGVLILSEKVAFNDTRHHELMIDLYHCFKRGNGYSDLEIAQKRDALENVLIPETLDQHRQRLKSAGFADADVWFQCFNFASLIAQK
ncbi:carboxy-S-adenosyl-L-methionine synthase CmoA [Halioxenophilus sp. WMMB6]|uniref:carboxy-S-adenosyl-L-methionine synthase CmoA n=1 Tax=Halioxenophilus sp. WMMB6 TaxID=3073815 RepID=UPI00295E8022|nr:carboxy-S-adenosyl-L-methionine synthase CmoA [Halioxenophilus sp. WMMB6]